MAQLTLIIGNKNYSSWSLRPWIFMKQFQIPFEEKRIALYTDTSDQELAPYFSDCKVPLLLDGDFVVWDSLAILEYLSDNYLDGDGWPSGVQARAIARSISAQMHSSFANLRSTLPMNCRKKFPNYKLEPEVRRDINRIKAIWHRCRTEYGTDGEWLFGDYCIADAMFAPVALRFEGYDVSLSGTEKDYVQRVLEHADMIKWINAGKDEKEVIEMGSL